MRAFSILRVIAGTLFFIGVAACIFLMAIFPRAIVQFVDKLRERVIPLGVHVYSVFPQDRRLQRGQAFRFNPVAILVS
jgi:hypothetical protein